MQKNAFKLLLALLTGGALAFASTAGAYQIFSSATTVPAYATQSNTIVLVPTWNLNSNNGVVVAPQPLSVVRNGNEILVTYAAAVPFVGVPPARPAAPSATLGSFSAGHYSASIYLKWYSELGGVPYPDPPTLDVTTEFDVAPEYVPTLGGASLAVLIAAMTISGFRAVRRVRRGVVGRSHVARR